MPTLLHISVSPRGDYSISRPLSEAAVQAWRDRNPGGRVIQRISEAHGKLHVLVNPESH